MIGTPLPPSNLPRLRVPFILLRKCRGGGSPLEWVSHGSFSRSPRQELSSLQEDGLNRIRDLYRSDIPLNQINLEYYLLDIALQGDVDQLKGACESFADIDSFTDKAVQWQSDVTFETLGFEALTQREIKSPTPEYKLIILAFIPRYF